MIEESWLCKPGLLPHQVTHAGFFPVTGRNRQDRHQEKVEEPVSVPRGTLETEPECHGATADHTSPWSWDLWNEGVPFEGPKISVNETVGHVSPWLIPSGWLVQTEGSVCLGAGDGVSFISALFLCIHPRIWHMPPLSLALQTIQDWGGTGY